MKMRRLVAVGMAAAIVASISGCATGPKKVHSRPSSRATAPRKLPSIPVEFTSMPAGAVVTLDDSVLGTTPFTANVSQKPHYTGPTTLNFSSATFEEGFNRIEKARRMANYIFIATKEGYMEARMEIPVNDGLPPVVQFKLEPRIPPKSN